jgi:hypothetical protein
MMNNPLPAWADLLIVAGAIILVALAALVWAVFFHKRPRRRYKNRRQLNPTLAQVGGLPPVRLEEKPPCQPQPTSQP